jgi:hypothetical protein
MPHNGSFASGLSDLLRIAWLRGEETERPEDYVRPWKTNCNPMCAKISLRSTLIQTSDPSSLIKIMMRIKAWEYSSLPPPSSSVMIDSTR